MNSQNYRSDRDFLADHTRVIELSGENGARVAVAPEWQGRAMTSALGGEEGGSFGWINRKFILDGKDDPKFNNFGGEDRFWLGPEAGQFGLWFGPGDEFTLRDFKTPAGFNSGPFQVAHQTKQAITMTREFGLTNYSGARFECGVRRTLRMLDAEGLSGSLGASIPSGLHSVAFESVNTLSNIGREPWRPESGLLSVWILGMFKPLPNGVVIAPFIPGDEAALGNKVNAYFGEISKDRLQVNRDHALFRCDGAYRSKIGISRSRSVPLVASWDPDDGVLTLVTFNLPSVARHLPYVNSQWEIQKEPYAGDVVNSYNDGRDPITGTVLGPFYELETSSAAAALEPGGSIAHVHRTAHFSGPREKMAQFSELVLGMDVTQIKGQGN